MRKSKRGAGSAESIKNSVGELLACSAFSASRFVLPSAAGAQVSLSGDITAVGNKRSSAYGDERLRKHLSSLPYVYKGNGDEIGKYISSSRFTILCGDCDRSVAIATSIGEIISAGVGKIIVAADTVSERDNLFSSLHLMRSTLAGAEVLAYRPSIYGGGAEYNLKATVYAFLTSESPSILVLGQDSFCRRTNFIRRNIDSESSLASLISLARPVVITSSGTVSSGRALAKSTSALNPLLTLIYAGEVRPIRDAVIYKPAGDMLPKEKKTVPEQLTF